MDVKLRKIQDSDKDTYIKLQKETWINKKNLESEEQNDRLWSLMFSDTEVHYAVLVKDQICGFVSVMKLDKEIQELGIELFTEFQHQGIGYQAVVRLLEICKNHYHMQKIHSRVYADNYPSILLMRKLGAIPYQIARNNSISESSLLKFQKENTDLISENMREMAKLFHVQPDQLLSNLLVFQIPIPIDKIQFDLALTGNLSYEKKIETQATRWLYLDIVRHLKSLKEKNENSTNEEFKEALKAEIKVFIEKLEAID